MEPKLKTVPTLAIEIDGEVVATADECRARTDVHVAAFDSNLDAVLVFGRARAN